MRLIDIDYHIEEAKRKIHILKGKVSECEFMHDIPGFFKAKTDIKTQENIIHVLSNLQLTESTYKWIPCSERLPKEGENVLVCLENETYDIAFYSTKYCSWISSSDEWSYEKESVVAWMPLPEPYKENE